MISVSLFDLTAWQTADAFIVNGTNLLLALGIPSLSTRTTHLKALPSHVAVPATSPSGVPLQKGIPGIWIPLSAAREMARRLEPGVAGWLGSLLRDDLSDMVRLLFVQVRIH